MRRMLCDGYGIEARNLRQKGGWWPCEGYEWLLAACRTWDQYQRFFATGAEHAGDWSEVLWTAISIYSGLRSTKQGAWIGEPSRRDPQGALSGPFDLLSQIEEAFEVVWWSPGSIRGSPSQDHAIESAGSQAPPWWSRRPVPSSMMKCTMCPEGNQSRRSGGNNSGESWSMKTKRATMVSIRTGTPGAFNDLGLSPTGC